MRRIRGRTCTLIFNRDVMRCAEGRGKGDQPTVSFPDPHVRSHDNPYHNHAVVIRQISRLLRCRTEGLTNSFFQTQWEDPSAGWWPLLPGCGENLRISDANYVPRSLRRFNAYLFKTISVALPTCIYLRTIGSEGEGHFLAKNIGSLSGSTNKLAGAPGVWAVWLRPASKVRAYCCPSRSTGNHTSC